MVEINTTWQAFLDEVCQQAEQEQQGYHIYEGRDGTYRQMSDTTFQQQKGYLPGRAIAYVYAEPIMHGDEVVARYELVGDLVDIDPDKKVRRGAPLGNDNAAKGRYPRRVLSLVGPDFDLVMDHFKKQGNDNPSNSEILEAVNSALRRVYSDFA